MIKKILIFSLDYYPGEVGGAEVAIKEITDRIPQEEYEFHLITLHYDKSMLPVENLDGVLVHRIGFGRDNPTIDQRRQFPLHLNKHLFQFTAAFKAWRLHRKYHYDGTWAMMAHSCGVPAALFKLIFPNVKFVLTLQEGDPPEEIERKAKPLWPLFKRAFTTADTIQVISNFLGKWATSMGAQVQPILVPNAVNTEHFSAPITPEVIEKKKRELGKSEGDVFLVTTSRLVHKNAIDMVIAAIPGLPENVQFIVFGNGPDVEALQSQAADLGVADRVKFKGLISHADMPAYLAACDIFIRPSRSEGMGNSFVEAMVARLPVIATQAGGIADFLFDSERNPEKEPTGWAVDRNNSEQIVAAVERILGDEEATKRTVENAYQLAVTNYDWNVIAKRMKTEVFDPLW